VIVIQRYYLYYLKLQDRIAVENIQLTAGLVVRKNTVIDPCYTEPLSGFSNIRSYEIV
jgi:hypothetical protein